MRKLVFVGSMPVLLSGLQGVGRRQTEPDYRTYEVILAMIYASGQVAFRSKGISGADFDTRLAEARRLGSMPLHVV